MNQIDSNLYNAWQRVVERCRRDPVENLRRALRQMGKGLNQPMGDWCLCLRASDRRIDSGDVIIEALPDEDLCIEDEMRELITLRKAHLVTLEGRDVRRLTAPIFVHLPGVPQKELAKMAGVKRGFTGRWIKAGRASVVDIGPRGEKIVWTPGGLDPASRAIRGTAVGGRWPAVRASISSPSPQDCAVPTRPLMSLLARIIESYARQISEQKHRRPSQ